MSIPAKISELVERFQQNASEYRSATYNETQAKSNRPNENCCIRQVFLAKPFFPALQPE
ncbi:hypothetical protein HCU40_18205 [Pseudanabaena biceps]|nr:hypothetical protein [Pseudanabaena biceps]